ncbi:hypothetical protein ABH946_003113 [Bacillus sp. RC145]
MLNLVKNYQIFLSLENEILKRFAYEEVEKVGKIRRNRAYSTILSL